MTAAIALLTRVPVRTDGHAPAGAAAFGLVGAVLGLAARSALLAGAAPLPGAVLALAVLAIASGALHLDGLADTADALVAPTTPTPPSGPPGSARRSRRRRRDRAGPASSRRRSPGRRPVAVRRSRGARHGRRRVARGRDRRLVSGSVRPGFGAMVRRPTSRAGGSPRHGDRRATPWRRPRCGSSPRCAWVSGATLAGPSTVLSPHSPWSSVVRPLDRDGFAAAVEVTLRAVIELSVAAGLLAAS